MIPIRLELKNFMSYGEDVPPIDFSGMHTLCLSGENGHGKSALLDALTWSLWGESRAGKNKHDDLVRIGADEMSVHFTFEMDGQRYRVIRKRSKKATGNLWELQQETPDLGLGIGWRSLTGNNAGETEKAIQKLLRMSYDTFLNSAYLRQGQADQFVRQTPGKRKEILADILDLSRYDQLEDKARARMKDAQAEATDLERDISGIDAELSHEPELRAQLAELQTRREGLLAQRIELMAEWDALNERKSQLKSQKDFADQLQAQITGLNGEIRDLTEELAGHQGQAEQSRALLSRQDEICRDYEKLLAARERLQGLERDLEQFHRGQQALAAAEKEWMAAENDVQRRMEMAVREHEQAVARFRDYPLLKAEREAIAPRVAAADRSEEQMLGLRDTLAAVQEQFTRLREENAAWEWQVKDWDRKIGMLSQQKGVCDVCNSDLPASKVTDIQQDYEAALQQAKAKQKQIKAEAGRVKTEIQERESQLKTLDAQTKAAKTDRARLAQIEQNVLALEAIQLTLPNLAAVRDQTVKTLEEGLFAPELRQKIQKCETALAKLATVETDYAGTRGEESALASSERLHIALEHAQTALTSAETSLARIQKGLKTRQASRDAAQAQLAGLADVGAELAQLETRGQQIREQEKQRAVEEQGVSHDIGGLGQKLARLDEQRGIRADKAKRLADAKYTQEVHEQLTRAFGKKGVQALIIENAIPELEEEANRLLHRLTDGDMSLYFDTLRESKSKSAGPIETLDIKVSDNLGTRPLEMYSGGEGFRAAFALRIALSKLLTRRAGARLQTLIIDEGFGSQDAKGREKLIDCINAIKDDFQRIIVITHIDELKDAFATRVEVTKTPSGSHVTVMEGAAG